MTISVLNIHITSPAMHKKKSCSKLWAFILFATISLVFSQNLTDNCPLDIHLTSIQRFWDCTQWDWSGFFNSNCCRYAFDGYLLALTKQANRTGQIFLNATQQKNCLESMKGVGSDVSKCGIEKLIRGDSRCSDYSVTDVVRNMGNRLNNLERDCEILGSGDKSDETCGSCLRRWVEIDVSRDNDTDLSVVEDVCKFFVLLALSSTRVDDEKWIKALCKCLSQNLMGFGHLVSFADDQVEEQKDDKTANRKSKMAIEFLIGGLVGIIGMLIVVTWIICWKSGKPQLVKEKSDQSNSPIVVSSPIKIALKDVYFATNDLNESNFIGQGIAGKVYQGVLSNGKHIAVKHIMNDGQMETFVREVQSLSHVKHPNLVTLIGYCEKEAESFLVYELCHNGNLSDWLFGKENNLTWSKRLEIALDCARGLSFLHTYRQGCIVHRDIKPTNILLCADFRGKLSDFGLSKVMNMGQSFVSSEVRGTFGYVDPEYQQNRRVNSFADVYSFGIVLLQLLSGQKVINLDTNKPMPISKMAKALTKSGNIFEFADPKLKGEYLNEAFELVLNLALLCSGIKQQRPSMKEVVKSLEHALELSKLSANAKYEIPSFSQDYV